MQREDEIRKLTGTVGRRERSAGAEMVRGSVWMVAMRWTMRGIGVISTLILVRLLDPSDFGIIALAMIVVGFLEVMAQSGVELALIRGENPDRDDYDSAWTLQIIVSTVIAVVLFAIAPAAASGFDEPKLVAVIQALSLRSLLSGFQNIGIMEFRKSLNFPREFTFNVLKKISGFVITVGLAIALQNYWALVFGMITGTVAEVLLSYAMHPYRPRLCVRKIRSLVPFSGWLVAFYVCRFLGDRADIFVIGGVAGTAFIGNYYVASEVATAPTSELVAPMSRGLYPVYSRMQSDQSWLVTNYLRVLSTVALLCVPIGFGIAAVAEDMVLVFLGSRWRETIPLIEYLAVFGSFFAITNTILPFLTVVGRVRLLALITGANALALAATLLFVTRSFGVEFVAASRCALGAVAMPIVFLVMSLFTELTLKGFLMALWHRFAAGILMLITVKAVHQQDLEPVVLRLSMDIGVGVVVFSLAVVALWFLRGCPADLEHAFANWLIRKVSSIRWPRGDR
jgi:O-antigen/teichoic acid export membrane protein